MPAVPSARRRCAAWADGLRSYASSYAGNNSQGAANLVLYLRAGYYVQYYNSADVGSYGAGLKTSLQGALDTLFNNATIFQNSNAMARRSPRRSS